MTVDVTTKFVVLRNGVHGGHRLGVVAIVG